MAEDTSKSKAAPEWYRAGVPHIWLPYAQMKTAPAPLPVAFDGSASTPDTGGAITSYAWDYGDGSSPGAGTTSAHTYPVAGGYNARLTVTGDSGISDTATHQVSVSQGGILPPLASIQVTPTTGAAPLGVTFSCACSDPQGLPLTYAWDFGDGTTSSAAAPSHTYLTAGVYRPKLSVWNGTLWTTDGATVRVSSPHGSPPEVRLFADPPAGTAPLTVSLHLSALDADGTIVSTRIALDDGSVVAASDLTHTYGRPGRFQAIGSATDDSGNTSSDQVEVVVVAGDGAVPPRIVSVASTTAQVGVPYAYDGDGRLEAVGAGPIEYGLDTGANQGVTVEATTGLVSWTPAQEGDVLLVFTARTQGAQTAAYQSVHVTVTAGSQADGGSGEDAGTDGGTADDGGTIAERPHLGVGCACDAAGGSSAGAAWACFAGLIAVALRKRRASAR